MSEAKPMSASSFLMYLQGQPFGQQVTMAETRDAAIRAEAVAGERERCEQIAYDTRGEFNSPAWNSGCKAVAAAIRGAA